MINADCARCEELFAKLQEATLTGVADLVAQAEDEAAAHAEQQHPDEP